jgi:hypothetical protein
VVCDQNKVNGNDVTYADNGNLSDSDEVKSNSFRKVKSSDSDNTCSYVNTSSTNLLSHTSRFLSRFGITPGNKSSRVRIFTDSRSLRPCLVSSTRLSIFDNDVEHNLHPGPCSSLININETTRYHEDTPINIRSNASGSGLPCIGGVGARDELDLNLFSPKIQT